jgi:hypothetical protein
LEGIPGLWVWHKYSNTGDQDYQRRNFRHCLWAIDERGLITNFLQ